MPDFELSSYQKDILDYFVKNPHSNILINALAGSGKSSTLRLLTEHTKTSDVYLAFNNSVAEEFRQKITNPKTKVYTIHALSFLIMNTNLSDESKSNKKGGFGKKPGSNESAKLDNLKPYKILDSIYPSEFGKISFEYKQFLSSNFISLYNLVRVTMTDLDNIEEINKLVKDHNLFIDLSENNFKAPNESAIYSIINRLDKKSKAQFESEKTIDFTDMIYITYWKLKEKEWTVPYWLLFTNIYLDECLPGYIHVPCLINDGSFFNERHFTLENLWKMQERDEKLPFVVSYNELNKILEFKQIKKVMKRRIAKTWGIRINKLCEFKNSKETITKKDFQDIRSTDKHLFLTEDGWKYMKDLKIGDKVLIMDRSNPIGYSYAEIIKTFPGKVERVYDIEVEDNHTFVAKSDPHDNGFIVHNCQDQNNLQLNIIKFIKREGGRYIAVGDEHQCHPLGTKIYLQDGQIKNIEDIEIGDKVIEYSTDLGLFRSNLIKYGKDNSFVGANSKGANNPNKQSFEVVDKQNFYTDEIIKIKLENGLESSYTNNHRCYVKFNEKTTQNATCLYLMERMDGYFRIGTVKMYASQSSLGIKFRTRSEKFDRAWILNVYDTDEEAWVNEQKYSLKYQIPQLIFDFKKVKYNQEELDYIYNGVPDIRRRAISLLEEFGRDIHYPLYIRQDVHSHLARTHAFLTQACNIIPKYMDALFFDENNRRVYQSGKNAGGIRAVKSSYSQIISIERIKKLQEVIGLTTTGYHNYVADGILTHNSVYNFTGSNAYSFNLIPQMFAPMKEFDLPICYRCPKSHLKKVNDQFGIPIIPRDDAPEGKIKTINKNQIIKYIQPGDMIISRKNKWLSDIIPELVANGFSVYMEDKEMVAAIKKMIDPKKFRTVIALENNLIKSYENFLNKGHKNKKGNLSTKYIKTELEKNNKENLIKNNLNTETEDINSTQIDNLLFLLTICKYYSKNYNSNNNLLTFGKFVNKILCTEPNDEAIRVTSVHKAKGLEADNVFVLNEGKICYIPMNSKEQNIQEKNLSYISITRAKENLYLVREESK